MRRSLRIVITLAIMAIFATGAYAFTAPNSVPPSNAGFGGDGINGYDVTGVHYVVDTSGTTPQITDVKFQLLQGGINQAPSMVQARINSGTWSANCSNDVGIFTCDVDDIDVDAALDLEVLAYDS